MPCMRWPSAWRRACDPRRDVIAGDNSAAEYTGAERIQIRHELLQAGDRCPECWEGKVYPQREPHTRIRIVGQAPIHATVYEMESLRCNGCGEVFTGQPTLEAAGEKFDATAAAMMAQLRYGSGMPFQRLERLGIPLPAATQWDVVEHASGPVWPDLQRSPSSRARRRR